MARRVPVGLLAVAGLLLLPGASLGQEETSAPGADPRLLTIKKVCIENFAGEEALGAQAKEMAIASLYAAKRFALTENCDKADAVLKGMATQQSEQRARTEAESMEFGKAAGAAVVSGSSGSAAVAAARGADSEVLSSVETRRHAAVTLRIVDKEGDILWATTQESPGGKVKGPVADAVDRAVKQLLRDIERAEKKKAAGPA